MVFQNPFDTLNPSHTVGSQIGRVIKKFGVESDPQKIQDRVYELLDIVKLPRDFAIRRPRQLSGGQKQRVGIARAFAGNPKVVIADEPVSALDVSVQAAVTQLLMDIQREHRTTLLFISHDLSVVRYLSDRVIVMYLGQIMEKGSTEEIFSPPYHPYTEALLSAVPIADTKVEKRKIVLEGEIPSPLNPPKGCPFCTRCQYVIEGLCESTPPPVKEFASRHAIACHLDFDTLRNMQPVIQMEDSVVEPPKTNPVAEMVVAAIKATAPDVAPAPDTTDSGEAGLAELDDLKRISGIGGVLEEKLNTLGVTTFAQIAAWTPEDVARMDEQLNFKAASNARIGSRRRSNWPEGEPARGRQSPAIKSTISRRAIRFGGFFLPHTRFIPPSRSWQDCAADRHRGRGSMQRDRPATETGYPGGSGRVPACLPAHRSAHRHRYPDRLRA